jgi:hypothetical protein
MPHNNRIDGGAVTARVMRDVMWCRDRSYGRLICNRSINPVFSTSPKMRDGAFSEGRGRHHEHAGRYASG